MMNKQAEAEWNCLLDCEAICKQSQLNVRPAELSNQNRTSCNLSTLHDEKFYLCFRLYFRVLFTERKEYALGF